MWDRLDLERVGLQSCDPERVGLQSCDPERVGLQSYDSEWVGLQLCDPERVGLQSCDLEAQSHDLERAGRHSLAVLQAAARTAVHIRTAPGTALQWQTTGSSFALDSVVLHSLQVLGHSHCPQ